MPSLWKCTGSCRRAGRRRPQLTERPRRRRGPANSDLRRRRRSTWPPRRRRRPSGCLPGARPAPPAETLGRHGQQAVRPARDHDRVRPAGAQSLRRGDRVARTARAGQRIAVGLDQRPAARPAGPEAPRHRNRAPRGPRPAGAAAYFSVCVGGKPLRQAAQHNDRLGVRDHCAIRAQEGAPLLLRDGLGSQNPVASPLSSSTTATVRRLLPAIDVSTPSRPAARSAFIACPVGPPNKPHTTVA
jgi:hypothetical protein